MKKLLKILVLLSLAFLISSPAALAITTGSEKIEVHVEMRELSIELNVANSLDDPYISNNAQVQLHLSVIGAGRIIITDQSGNIFWQHDKITDAPEEFNPVITLFRVDNYVITAIITGRNGSFVSDTQTIEFVSLVPGAPGTSVFAGYLYIGGYAIPGIWVTLFAVGALSLTLFVFFKHKKQTRDAA